jgi:hypothetical protein
MLLPPVSIQVSPVGPPDRDDVPAEGPLVGGVKEEDALRYSGAAEVVLEDVVLHHLGRQLLVGHDLLLQEKQLNLFMTRLQNKLDRLSTEKKIELV